MKYLTQGCKACTRRHFVFPVSLNKWLTTLQSIPGHLRPIHMATAEGLIYNPTEVQGHMVSGLRSQDCNHGQGSP